MSVQLDPHQAAELAAQARVANQLALDHPSLLAFYLDGGWARRAHTELISQHLADLATGACRRLLVTLPPQVGKSRLIAEQFPFWWLCRNPQHRVIIGSYGSNLAVTRGRAIRRM